MELPTPPNVEPALQESEAVFTHHYPAPDNLDRIFQENGTFDGKLFVASDKATFTYLNDGDVISLHFDSARRTLFCKGHKITDLADPVLADAISQFHSALAKDEITKNLLNDFDLVVTDLKRGVLR